MPRQKQRGFGMQNIENDTGQVRAFSLPLQGRWGGRSMRRDHRRQTGRAKAKTWIPSRGVGTQSTSRVAVSSDQQAMTMHEL